MELKRYWLFLYPEHKPLGGMQDLVFTSNSIPECRKFLREKHRDDYHYEIFDAFEKIILETSVNQTPGSELYQWLNRDKKEDKSPPSRSMFH